MSKTTATLAALIVGTCATLGGVTAHQEIDRRIDAAYDDGYVNGSMDLCQQQGLTPDPVDGTCPGDPTPPAKVKVKTVFRTVSVPAAVRMWEGFATGEVVVCPGSKIEVDDYAGGQFAHCDGETLR